jgi:hypothetical protein
MTTLPRRALVSMFAAFVLGACATGGGHGGNSAGDAERGRERPRPLAIRFDNNGRDRVHVYLVGDRREWLLGRVDPDSRTWLPLPVRSLMGEGGQLRLAVIPGQAPSLAAGRDARAVMTLVQPATAILDREWSFTHGQLVSMRPTAAR